MIHGSQELMQAYNQLCQDEVDMRVRKEKEYDDQNATTIELEAKINIARSFLLTLRKRAASTSFAE